MNQSVLKAIKILNCFLEKPELTLVELVELTKMPKTNIFRIISALVEGGLLVKEVKKHDDVRYRLGFKMIEFGRHLSKQLDYMEVIMPYMKKLNEDLDESVHLTILEGSESVCIEKLESKKPIRIIFEVGKRVPLYVGSAPKLLLAYMDEESRENYLNTVEFKKYNKNTIDNISDLKKEIQEIRNNGYSYSNSENFKDTIGISCPIFDYNGNLVVALSVSVPNGECSPEREKIILKKTLLASESISDELGYKQIQSISQ